MSVEMRHLAFSRDEVISAVLDHCRDKRIALPDAAFDRIEMTSGFEPSLTICFQANSPMDTDRVTLSSRELMSALEEYCRGHEIPVSRHPEKQLRVTDDELTLFYRIRHSARCRLAA